MDASEHGAPEAGHEAVDIARRNPWWIPPFLGRVPPIETRLITLLGFVSFALFFENYDFSLLNAALKYIAADLAIPEEQLGNFTALIRFGGLPAFLLIPLADQVGRRRIFIAAVAGLSLGTFLTGFSGSAVQFVAFQALARSSMLVAATVAVVIITEEFPALHRGWGIGMLTAVAAVGHGMGALMFSAIEVLPYGWRSLYAIGAIPLFLLPMFRRGIPETRRFTEQAEGAEAIVNLGRAIAAWFRPIGELARQTPVRASGIAFVGGLSAFGHAVAHAFIGYFVLTVHHWAPWQYSLMVVLCGAVGVGGNVVAGRLSDRMGRRLVGFLMLAVFPVSSWAFFQGPSWSLPVVWIVLVFTTMGGNVIVRAFATELFPTSRRGTSAGLLMLAETVGAGSGLAMLSYLMSEPGQLALLIPVVTSATLVAGIAALFFPETRLKELEAISGP